MKKIISFLLLVVSFLIITDNGYSQVVRDTTIKVQKIITQDGTYEYWTNIDTMITKGDTLNGKAKKIAGTFVFVKGGNLKITSMPVVTVTKSGVDTTLIINFPANQVVTKRGIDTTFVSNQDYVNVWFGWGDTVGTAQDSICRFIADSLDVISCFGNWYKIKITTDSLLYLSSDVTFPTNKIIKVPAGSFTTEKFSSSITNWYIKSGVTISDYKIVIEGY